MYSNELKERIMTGVATVTFTKTNGEQRVMRCTQDLTRISSGHYPKQDSLPQRINEDIERVFDLDISEWRSFRKDSVTTWE